MKRIFLALSFVPTIVISHSSTDHQIADLTKTLREKPQREALVGRAILFRRQLRFQDALRDLNEAEKRFGFQNEIAYEKAILHAKMKNYALAQSELRRFDVRDPYFQNRQSAYLMLEAKIQKELHLEDEALRSYQQALAISQDPSPDDFLLYKKLSSHVDEVKYASVLELGVKKLGYIPVLSEELIDLYTQMREYDKALKVLNAYTKSFVNQEPWKQKRENLILKASAQSSEGSRQ